jgi:hypothetical protein
MAVPWLRRLVAGLAPRASGFDPGLFNVVFVVDRVAQRQVFVPVLRFFSLSLSLNRFSTLISIYMLPLSEGQTGEVSEPSKSNILSEIGGHWTERCFQPFRY